MKRRIFIATVIFSVLWGCNGSGNPKLEANVESINFCNQALGESVVWNNLQLRNVGRDILNISRIRIRGDENCAFSCEYSRDGEILPCLNEDDDTAQTKISIKSRRTLLVRIKYTPSSSDEQDIAALVIESNAVNLETDEEKTDLLVLPMCGIAGAGTVTGDAGDVQDGGLLDAGVDVEECGACETVPEKGAPSCSDRS